MTLSRVIEALLFGSQKPLSVRELTEAIRRAGSWLATPNTPSGYDSSFRHQNRRV